jgi:hypothetical protein
MQKKNKTRDNTRSGRAAASDIFSASVIGLRNESVGDRCPKVRMSAGMFYTDTFIEVAVPFPPCRNRIPVSYACSLTEFYFGMDYFPVMT